MTAWMRGVHGNASVGAAWPIACMIALAFVVFGVVGCATGQSADGSGSGGGSADRAGSAESTSDAVAGASAGAASTPAPNAAGRATATTQADLLGSVPGDLTVDLTILPGRDLRERSEAHVVQSKYILFPDGSLHGDRGRSMAYLVRPARVRVVSREVMSDLWLLLRQSGFEPVASPAPGAAEPFTGNPSLLAPTAGEVLSILSVRANGTSSTFLRRGAPAIDGAAETMDASMTRVARAVARLAWATDEPSFDTYVQPLRYDFGPDPYAPYRPKPVTSGSTPTAAPRTAPTGAGASTPSAGASAAPAPKPAGS